MNFPALQVYVTRRGPSSRNRGRVEFTAQVNSVFKGVVRVGDTLQMSIKREDLLCDCPGLVVSRQYLLIGAHLLRDAVGTPSNESIKELQKESLKDTQKGSLKETMKESLARGSERELWLMSETIVLPWHRNWSERMHHLISRTRDMDCQGDRTGREPAGSTSATQSAHNYDYAVEQPY